MFILYVVQEGLVQGVYVVYCTRVFSIECHIQFKSDSYRVFKLYVIQNCLIQGVYVMYCKRVFSAECIFQVQLKSD